MYRQAELALVVIAHGGNVCGVDLQTGREIWRHPMRRYDFPVELHVEETIVLAVAGGVVFCIDRLSGAERWKVAIEGSRRATMLVDGDHILVACEGKLTCLGRDGTKRWHNALEDLDGLESTFALGVPGHVRQADETG